VSIKAAVKEHFAQNLISDHLTYFFPHLEGVKATGSVYEGNILNVRKFTLEDMDKCAELFRKVFRADPWYDEWVSFDQARDYLDELVENPVFEGFVVSIGSDVAAVCLGHKRSWWMGKEFFVDEFFVENERQGNGIGTSLLDYVTNSLADEGYTRLTLLTNKEIPAEDFYLKNGFYNNQKRTVMVKEL
jgi:aminoglycoside 6'-N-acetyltransferase I